MNNYAIFKMGKLKSAKDLKDAYFHNERIYNVENADPLKIQDNIELTDTMGLSYEDMFDNELSHLKAIGVPERTIRKDAVLGFEVIMTFSREQTDNIDLEDWAKACHDFIDKEFNPPNHKIKYKDSLTNEEKTATVQNIHHEILHLDESKPHIHAFIIPIDEKGNLNSHYYNSGRYRLMQLQTDFAKKMKPFGLIRGTEHSIANPEQMSRYYNHIINAVEAKLPEPQKNETIEEYKSRAEDVYQQALSNHRNDMVKKNQEIIHLQSEANRKVLEAKKEIAEDKKLFNNSKSFLSTSDEEPERTIAEAFIENKRFKKAVENHPDNSKAEEALFLYNEMINWEIQRENVEHEEKEDR